MSRAFGRLARRHSEIPVDAADSDMHSCMEIGRRTDQPIPDLQDLQRPSSVPARIGADDSWIKHMDMHECASFLRALGENKEDEHFMKKKTNESLLAPLAMLGRPHQRFSPQSAATTPLPPPTPVPRQKRPRSDGAQTGQPVHLGSVMFSLFLDVRMSNSSHNLSTTG